MKTLRILAASAVILAAPLGACSTLNIPPAAGSQIATIKLTTGKALLTADAAVIGAAQALRLAADSGYLKGANALTAKSYLDRANAALDAAHAAYGLSDIITANARVSEALARVADAQAFTQGAAQ